MFRTFKRWIHPRHLPELLFLKEIILNQKTNKLKVNYKSLYLNSNITKINKFLKKVN